MSTFFETGIPVDNAIIADIRTCIFHNEPYKKIELPYAPGKTLTVCESCEREAEKRLKVRRAR